MSEMFEELPSPPPMTVRDVQAGEENLGQPIDSEIDGSLFAEVPKMMEAIPVGTYAFRLDSFKDQWTTKKYNKDGSTTELTDEQKQPYFALQWKCQQEPYVGRVVFENVPWVRPEDVRDAANGQSPRRSEARKVLNDRLPRAKEIMEAAGFTPSGQMKFRDFLGTNPEIKLQLKIKERMAKGPDGRLKGSGEWGNEVTKHLSLHRPM